MPSGANNVCTVFGGIAPSKFGIAKNVQNLSQFRTTFNFDHEYFWIRWRNRQAVSGIMNYHVSLIEQKSWINFGPLTTTVSWLMSTYPKSTLRFLPMLMRWSSGHVTLLRGECEPLNCPPNRTYGARQTHVGPCLKYVVDLLTVEKCLIIISSTY